jgi:hypothetical protein
MLWEYGLWLRGTACMCVGTAAIATGGMGVGGVHGWSDSYWSRPTALTLRRLATITPCDVPCSA